MEREEIFWALLRVAAADLSEGRLETAEVYWARFERPEFTVKELHAVMEERAHMLLLLRRKRAPHAANQREGVHGPQRPR